MKTDARRLPDHMAESAALFRAEAAKPETDEDIGRVLSKVAIDYERCAHYIRSLEDRLAKFELQAVRNQDPLARLRRSRHLPPPAAPDAA